MKKRLLQTSILMLYLVIVISSIGVDVKHEEEQLIEEVVLYSSETDIGFRDIIIKPDKLVCDEIEEEVDEVYILPQTPPQPQEQQPVSTDYVIDFLCKVTFAEAGNQSELGVRLVMDAIFNRVEHEKFPNDIISVLCSPGQFSTVRNGAPVTSYYPEEYITYANEELVNRTNSDVLFFRAGGYHSIGVPLLQEGAHYFSGF